MKKSILLIIALLSLTFTTNALALVNYNQTFSYREEVELDEDYRSTIFTFNNILDKFVVSDKYAYPTLKLDLDGEEFKDTLWLVVGKQRLASFTSEDPTYRFTAETLGYLNNAIMNKSVDFKLVRNYGESEISSARLTGTVAPEPVSMALVGAGLAALPLARRIRKAIKS